MKISLALAAFILLNTLRFSNESRSFKSAARPSSRRADKQSPSHRRNNLRNKETQLASLAAFKVELDRHKVCKLAAILATVTSPQIVSANTNLNKGKT